MDDLRLAALARDQGGVVTTAQLRTCGLTRSGTRHRVATGRLFAIRRGAYALGPHVDHATQLWAAVLASDPRSATLSHWTAAHLHGMTSGRPSVVHLTIAGSGGRSIPGLVVHTPRVLPADDVVLVDGLRVTSPARTVLDIAATASDRDVVRLIREAELLGLLRSGTMARAVAIHPRHPGSARVRRVDPGTAEEALRQTPIEDELGGLVRLLPMPAPEPQLPVRGLSGAEYRLDFGWPPFRLGAEADGRAAHGRVSALESDRFRDNDLAGVGWVVLRFTRFQLSGPRRTDAVRQVLASAAARGWTGVAPGPRDPAPGGASSGRRAGSR